MHGSRGIRAATANTRLSIGPDCTARTRFSLSCGGPDQSDQSV